MNSLQILFFLILGFSTVAGAYILIAKPTNGSPLISGGLCVVFAAYTVWQIAQEGVVMFLTNHSANLTGLQVWWDLVMCVVIAFFFIAPRARAAGMNLLPWALLIGCTASIGILAMCARLFWLEAHGARASVAQRT